MESDKLLRMMKLLSGGNALPEDAKRYSKRNLLVEKSKKNTKELNDNYLKAMISLIEGV